MILTARREADLNALKEELEAAHKINATAFTLDLGGPGGADPLAQAVSKAGLKVDILINNAGFGGLGRHVERDLAEGRR